MFWIVFLLAAHTGVNVHRLDTFHIYSKVAFYQCSGRCEFSEKGQGQVMGLLSFVDGIVIRTAHLH